MKVIITGGSSGIGLALAKLLGQRSSGAHSFDVQEPLAKLPGVIHIEAVFIPGLSKRWQSW